MGDKEWKQFLSDWRVLVVKTDALIKRNDEVLQIMGRTQQMIIAIIRNTEGLLSQSKPLIEVRDDTIR